MTYEDFLKKAQTSGLLGQFSDYDLETAKKNPEFGMTMLSYKTDYANAADAAAKESINKLANELRAQYGSYTGGSDGSKYYATAPSPGGYQNPYQSKISEILDKMGTYGGFDYGEAPTYNNRYQQELDNLLNRVQNYEDFSWSKETDPSWSAYAKQYRREGERATQDALAQAAAASGGQVSTAAVTAASQAGDYYASQLGDMIPQLYQNAYNRYLNQYSMLLDQLNTTRQAEQYDYQAYLNELNQYNTDRNMSYDQWLQQYNMLGDTLGAYQGQSDTQYQQLLDQIEYNTNKQTLAQNQVDAILSAGGMPSADLIGSSGYTTEYVNALDSYYKQQAAKGNDGSGNDSEMRKFAQKQVDAILEAGGVPSAELLAQAGYSGEYADIMSQYYSGMPLEDDYKPNLTWPQVQEAVKAGNLTPGVVRDYEYYMQQEYSDNTTAGLSDLIGVESLGLKGLTFEDIDHMVTYGYLDYEPVGDKIRIKWAGKWNADLYKRVVGEKDRDR